MTDHTSFDVTRRRFLGAGGAVAAASALGSVTTAPAAAAVAPLGVGAAGDRHPGTQAHFPDSAFMHNNPNARVIDVTKVEEALGPDYAPPGTNATPDDPSDDDAGAFRAALQLIRDKLHETTDTQGVRKPQASFVIYVPNGVYHLERAIRYPGSSMDGRQDVVWALMRIVGQSRENTVLSFKDNLGLRRAAIVMFKQWRDQHNAHSYQHVLRNVTIDTGTGNPEVDGVLFQGANAAEIGNVTIRSGDGQGGVGLRAHRPVASGYIHDVTIDGFTLGIFLTRNHVMNPAFEYITLKNQTGSGVQLDNALPTIRSLRSENDVPAVTMAGNASNLALTDSTLVGGSADTPAISMNSGAHLFARNVAVNGYGTAIERAGEPEVDGDHIDEYVSDPVVTFDADQPAESMNLMVKDPPLPHWSSDPDTWADVTDFGAIGDGETNDAAAIQAACDSGAEIVYFPAVRYRVESTIRVPASVRRLECLFTTFNVAPDNSGPDEEALFRVAEGSSKMLFVDDIQQAIADPDVTAFAVDHAEPRPVSMTMVWGGGSSSAYRPHPTAANGDIFLNTVQGIGKEDGAGFRNQRVWARWINTENREETNFRVCGGATVWVLGYKSGEGNQTQFEVSDGGYLEVVGGLANEVGSGIEQPCYRVVDGNVSLVTCSRARRVYDPELTNGFEVVVDDTQGGINKVVDRFELPYRFGPGLAWVLPLYVSYDLSAQKIAFGTEDSGVLNYEGLDGVRFLTAVAAHQPFSDTGEFLRTVEQLSREWYRAGILTVRERSAILTAAARSDVGL